MTAHAASLVGLVLATFRRGGGAGPTVVFIVTILVVVGLLSTVVWRASRGDRRTGPPNEDPTSPHEEPDVDAPVDGQEEGAPEQD